MQKQQQQPAAGLHKQQLQAKPQQAAPSSQQRKTIAQSEQPAMWQQHRASSWQSEHRSWHERGGYNGYRIPEDHFSGYFGRDHGFRIYNRSFVILMGIRAFGTMVIGSGFLIRGRNTGRMTGMKTMMSISNIPLMDIICIIEGIQVMQLQSASR